MQLRAFPMYAGLPSEDQVKVFDSEPDPTFVRRVVVARDPPLSTTTCQSHGSFRARYFAVPLHLPLGKTVNNKFDYPFFPQK
jgi:hypothetical protein